MNGTSRAWVILVALAGGVLLFQLVERSQGWTARSRAELLGKELLAAETPEQATAIARELGALDDAAVSPLIQGLISEEPLVSAAASEEISRRLGIWRQLPRKASGTRVAALVRKLANEREAIPPEQQATARRWTEAILLWPLKGSPIEAAEVLADCEAVLELPEPDEELVAERLARLAKQKEKVLAQVSPIEVESPDNAASGDVSREDSTNLPPIVSPEDVLHKRTEPEPIADADSAPLPAHPREPRGIYAPGARPIEDAASPQEPALLPPVKASAVSDELASLPALDVMQDLQSEHPATVDAAEQELTRRGYKAAQLALARQLTSPDPSVRRKLVQSLPRARGIDPRPWLLRLSEDPDENVRSAALSILRTSQDPELLEQLR